MADPSTENWSTDSNNALHISLVAPVAAGGSK